MRGSFSPKIARSISLGKAAFSDNRPLLTSPSVPTAARITALKSLVFSRYLYHAGIAPSLPLSLSRRFEGIYNEFWHSLYNNTKNTIVNTGHRLSTRDLFSKNTIMPFSFVLRRFRISQFIRVVRHAPPFLRAILSKLIVYQKSWIHLVISDLNWIYTHSTNFETMPDPLESLAPWVEQIKKYPSLFSLAIDKIHKNNLQSYYENMFDPASSTIQSASTLDRFHCFICFRSFASSNGLTCHLARAHQYYNVYQLRINTSVCPCCNIDFGVRYLNIRHIQSTKCKHHVIQLPVLPKEQIALAIKEDNAKLRENTRLGMPRFSAHRRE